MLIAVACLAQLTCGPAHVVPSILIFATTVMFLRFGRSATTDVYLTLFVSIANAFLALAIFRQRYWLGLIGGGIALGLALMCKGPVSLVQTLFPFVVFLGLQRFTRCRRGISMGTITRDIRIPAILGATAMLAIGLPWYLTVLIRYREASGTLLKELDRQGAGLPPNTTFLGYWVLLPNLMPWIALFIAGIFVAGRYFRKSRRLGFLLILVVAPIAFMSCFPDRRDRYLFPMISPISILCAHAALLLKRSFPPRNVAAKLLWWGHWTTLLVLAIGVPPALWFFLKDRAHQPAISIPLATSILLTGIVLVLAALTLHRRVPLGFVYSTALLMLLLNAFFLYGWSRSVAGLSEMKPVADLLHYAFPTGKVVYYDPPPDGKPATFDLDIYLDRSVPVLSEWPAADQGVAAVVMLVKPGQPLPEFPGWTIWRDLVSRNHHWYMLVPTNYLSHK
jgi:4-amino-4-deoxy-L-arabinose transferase-like glycosyltransferase